MFLNNKSGLFGPLFYFRAFKEDFGKRSQIYRAKTQRKDRKFVAAQPYFF